jgi:cytochrome c peroxidase
VRCHNGPLLSDGKYYRLGASFRDPGRQSVTGKKGDRHKFRTPTLRDIAQTAPYMHDGSMRSLQDVVIFYLRSPPVSGPDGESIDITQRNGVSLNEVDDIVAFLKSLTGQPPKITRPELP